MTPTTDDERGVGELFASVPLVHKGYFELLHGIVLFPVRCLGPSATGLSARSLQFSRLDRDRSQHNVTEVIANFTCVFTHVRFLPPAARIGPA